MIRFVFAILAPFIFTACTTTSQPQDDNSTNMTVGTVQKEIKLGMSGAEVAAALGSPNMVSTDSERREVWIYDKISTNYVNNTSQGWIFAVIAGGSKSSRSGSKTQKTLTIIIKFDDNKLVRDFAYHSSKF